MAGRLKGAKRERLMDLVNRVIATNPDVSFKQFTEQYPDANVNYINFTRWKRQYLSSTISPTEDSGPVVDYVQVPTRRVAKRPYNKKPNKHKTYFTVCTFSSGVSEDAKTLLKDFLQVLRETGRARFEMIELMDPKIIEVREEHK